MGTDQVELTPARVVRGMAAGMTASLVQALIGKGEDIAFLPPWEDSNFAPRMVDRLAKQVGVDPSLAVEWSLGTGFHLGYGAMWGGLYAAARERFGPNPWMGGMLMGALIYAITFPRWGAAVRSGTERPPRRRTPGMEIVALSVAFGFGLCTSLLYERLR